MWLALVHTSVPEYMGTASFLENPLATWAQSLLGWVFTHSSIHNGGGVCVCVLKIVNKLYLVPSARPRVWITARKRRKGSPPSQGQEQP